MMDRIRMGLESFRQVKKALDIRQGCLDIGVRKKGGEEGGEEKGFQKLNR